jgi:hypothetical protein
MIINKGKDMAKFLGTLSSNPRIKIHYFKEYGTYTIDRHPVYGIPGHIRPGFTGLHAFHVVGYVLALR